MAAHVFMRARHDCMVSEQAVPYTRATHVHECKAVAARSNAPKYSPT